MMEQLAGQDIHSSNGDVPTVSPLCPELPSQPLLRHLQHAASTLPRSALPPGKGHLVLSVIFSPPRPTKMLYPWAHLDEPRQIAHGAKPFPSHPTQTWEEMIFFHAEWRKDDEHEDDAKMIMAIEGYHYTLPEHGSAVFYLSKLDSTGWGPRLNHPNLRRELASLEVDDHNANTRSPPSSGSDATSLTGLLTEHFLSYFMSLSHMPRLAVECLPLTHISLHILARAQAAYIFPNSPDNPLKRPLSDAKLIVWWRGVLSRVVELVRRSEAKEQEQERGDKKRIDAFYMVPGMDELESHPLIPLPRLSKDAVVRNAGWIYGHPYTATTNRGSSSDPSDLPPLPLFPQATSEQRIEESSSSSSQPSKVRTIATLMPRFEDDPQSRFLDELAAEGQELAAYGDLLRRSDSGASTATAISNDNTTAVAMSVSESRSSSMTSTSSATTATYHAHDSSQTVLPDSMDVKEMSRSRSGSSLPQTPSKKMKRTRSGAGSPYNLGSADGSSPPPRGGSGGSPTPTRCSPRLKEMERHRSPSKSPVKKARRLSSAKAQSPLRTSRFGSSNSAATEAPFSPSRSSSHGGELAGTSSIAGSGGSSSSTAVATTTMTTTTTMPRLTQAQLQALRSRLALDSVSADEFWIRMGFRQECSSGSLVGCFFLGVTRMDSTPLSKSNDIQDSSSSSSLSCNSSHPQRRPLLLPPIPPQPRSRFTIPIREVQKMMRNELQLDDCNWHLHRDSIELTQYFDEERGRLLAHIGRLEPAEKDETCLRRRARVLLRRTRSVSKSTDLQDDDQSRMEEGEAGGDGDGMLYQEKAKKVSKKHAKRNNADEDWIWRVGEGIVWSSLPMVGYPPAQVEKVKRQLEERERTEGALRDVAADARSATGESFASASGQANGNGDGNGNARTGVTMLSVKRKKKT